MIGILRPDPDRRRRVEIRAVGSRAYIEGREIDVFDAEGREVGAEPEEDEGGEGGEEDDEEEEEAAEEAAAEGSDGRVSPGGFAGAAE